MNVLRCAFACDSPMTVDERDTLFAVAQEMIRKKRRRKRVKTEAMHGILETHYEFCVVNAHLSGIEFFAAIETDEGEKNVFFLVRPGNPNPSMLSWFELHPGHSLLSFDDPVVN